MCFHVLRDLRVVHLGKSVGANEISMLTVYFHLKIIISNKTKIGLY